jgi:hypothetical protein
VWEILRTHSGPTGRYPLYLAYVPEHVLFSTFYGLGYQPVLPWLSAAAGSIVIEFGSKSGSFDPRCPTKGWGLPHLPVDLLFADDEAQTTRLRIEEYRVSKRGLTVHEFIPITYHKGIGIWRSAARA